MRFLLFFTFFVIFTVLKLIFQATRKVAEVGVEAMDSVYGTNLSEELNLKTYSPIESIIGLLIIVAYADGEMDEFEKSFINNTIKEFVNAGINENIFYRLWKNLAQEINHKYGCILDNFDIEKKIDKFCYSMNTLDNLSKQKVLDQLIVMIMTVAVMNDNLNNCQYRMVKYIAKEFNLGSSYIDDVLTQAGYFEENNKTLKNPYEILGVSEFDDIDTIKRKYRELVKKFHPDYISGKGLDKEFIQFANEKLKEINWAYEEIMKNL